MTGPKSIARRLLRILALQLGSQAVARHMDKADTASDILDVLDSYPGHPHLQRLAQLIVQPADSFQARHTVGNVVVCLLRFCINL
jgi:hypothetical protein